MKENQHDLTGKIHNFPLDPGVYIMRDVSGNIIYIGKASSLKKRVSSYFTRTNDLKTAALVKQIADIEYIITGSEIEALLLEINLIKKNKPKYNIRLKDDKRYPYIAVTLNEKFPRIFITRNIKIKSETPHQQETNDDSKSEKPQTEKIKYFGPYTDAGSARSTMSMINYIFKMKTCSKVLPLKNNERPCLNFQMNRCRGYCRNIVSHDDYREIIDTVVDFLKGNIQPVIDKLNLKMKYYSEKQMFEKAAELRDMLQYINQMTAQRNISTDIETDTDYIGIQKFNDEAIIILFEFRKGILLGKKIYFYKNAEYSENETIVAAFILDYYKITDIPEKIITSEELQDNEIISQYLKKKKNGNILLDSPKTDSDKGVVGLITKNLDIAVAEKYYQSVHSDQSKGLIELSQILNFKNTIRDIVCFDISNLQGTDSVASMSFFRDGLPYKKGYRRFKIRGYDQSNDPGMIHEAVSRYLQNIINENLQMPDLIVIDGGITQLSRAIEAGSNFDFDVSIISIAKKFELIYTDPKNEPIKIPAESPAIKIIQGVRDESHRFGVKYHRLLRKKRLLQTELININGIGEEKAKLLLKQFKSVNEIKNKTADELLTVKGLTKTNVEDIIDYFSNSSILSG